MAEAIAVSGFNIPPVPAGADVRTREGVPPTNALPDYASQLPTPAPVAPAAAPVAAPAAADPALAALLAALTAQGALAPAAVAAPVQEIPAGNGDPVLASLTSILSSSGLDVQRAIGNALAHGEVSLIDERYIREAGGANAQHLLNIAKGLIDHSVRESDTAANAVYAAAGGQANWHAALGSFEAAAPAHLKTVIKSLFDSGNKSSIEAATTTVLEFAKASGGLVQPAGLVTTGAGLGSAQALDKAGFQAELQKLDPRSRSYEQDRGMLFQRRSAGKQLNR